MKYCVSEECSGLDPCEGCTQVRRAILMRAVAGAGLNKETAEKFFRSYAEAFDLAMTEIAKSLEFAQQKRLEEKAAREKSGESPDKGKENRKDNRKVMGPDIHKVTHRTSVTSIKDRLGAKAPTATETPKNGQPPKKDPAVNAAETTHEHEHKD